HAQLLGKLLRRRLPADLVQHLAAGAYDFVDGLDHVHRDADGARLISDRTGNGLPDPPGSVGGELVTSPILELVNGFHQSDVAFLNEVKELQAAVGVFFCDGNNEAQVGLDHFLLGLAGFALALLHHLNDFAKLLDLKPGLAGESMDLAANLLDAILVATDEV